MLGRAISSKASNSEGRPLQQDLSAMNVANGKQYFGQTKLSHGNVANGHQQPLVKSYSASSSSPTSTLSCLNNQQRPFQLNSALSTASHKTSSHKMTNGRTMSTNGSLRALHEHAQFDEFDFDDVVDLTNSPPTKRSDLDYPQLDDIRYPSLPPIPNTKQPQKPEDSSSSAPVPWSSSPPSHFQPPVSRTVQAPKTTRGNENFAQPKQSIAVKRPSPSTESGPLPKRRGLPWPATSAENVAIPRPIAKFKKSSVPWDPSASAVRDSQKEFRKRNKPKAQVIQSEPKPMTHVPKEMLSQEQKDVVTAVIDEGKSVFFTGSAGTGKSVLMRSIIGRLREKYRREPDRVAITASTGLAACVIEGNTLHSWAGIGLGKEPAPELIKKVKRNAKVKNKWLRTKVLIVDEISMVDGELFDKLEHVARVVRNNGRPFGGIQLIVTGDFFQLPPVPDRNAVAKFAFDAATWNTCIEHTILLTHVFRQRDPTFANMLNEMRLGKLTQASINAFQRLSRPLQFRDEVEATELFPTRIEVENANNSRMRLLSGSPMTFDAVDSGITDLTVRNKMLANFMAPESLTLKKGSQVMLIKNIDTQLVNGSLGKVHSFMDENTFAVYKGDEETFLKAQQPAAEGDEQEKLAAIAKISAMRFKQAGEREPRYWPMVRFQLPDGTSRDMLCQPEEWKTENQQGEVTAKRVQVPLILAWALSIHKAQGQTLSRVKVDLGRVFERGQAYVALSRATTQEGLQVTRFDPKKVMVHPKVIQFYSKLAGADSLAPPERKKSSIADALSGQDKQKTLVATRDSRFIDHEFEDGIDDDELLSLCG